MKILLTGSTGMVGKNIVHFSRNLCYDIISPQRSEMDLLDYHSVEKTLKRVKPDIIVHAAGLVGGIQANIMNPTGFLYENVMMGFNLLHAASSCKIKRMINLGSSCMYPSGINHHLSENMIMSGKLESTNEAYALAKISVSRLCHFMSQQHGYQYKTIIPCNLYGYWDKFDVEKSHMIPAAIRKTHKALLLGSNIEIWGSGKCKREFMFAEDLADFIFFSLGVFEDLPDIMNVGLGKDHTILEYYTIIREAVGSSSAFYFDTSRPEGMSRKVVDISHQTKLGWSPKTSLIDGVKKTYEHYLETVI